MTKLGAWWPLFLGLACVSPCGCSGNKISETDSIDLADRAWCRGDSTQTQNLLEGVLQHDSKSFAARYRLALIPIDSQPNVALEQLNALARDYPKHPGPVFYAGLARLRLNDFTRAEADLRRGYLLSQAQLGYALKDTSQAAREGLSAWTAGRYAASAEAFRRATQADSTDATLWFLQARTLTAYGDLDGAAQAVGKALSKRPSFPVAHALRAEILRLKKQNVDARQEVKLALKDAPEQVQALYQLGLLDLDEGESRAAAIDFWHAVLADPTFPPPHQALGQTFMHMDQLPQGMPYFQHFEWANGFLDRYLGRR
jgi:tetratricopeptide (TPR) repeat protein